MRSRSIALVALFVMPPLAVAGRANRAQLVPAYRACPPPDTICQPQGTQSPYSFDTAVLETPARPFVRPGKIAIRVVLRGVRDASGALVTTNPADPGDDFVLRVAPGRVVLLGRGGPLQLEPGSLLSPPTEVRVDLQNGKGAGTFVTPDDSPTSGLVTQSLGLPALYDPDGRLLATTGARSKD